jgi:RimJ/RimL family protein N-acetyltransferase
VLLKAGFRQEGVRVSQWEVQGKRQDGLIFGLPRTEKRVF